MSFFAQVLDLTDSCHRIFLHIENDDFEIPF